MQQIDIAAITDKLTPNQRNTIESLHHKDYCILGCAEPVAIRLCRDGIRRPALVERIKGSEFWNFRLTEIGRQVKVALSSMAWARSGDHEPQRY